MIAFHYQFVASKHQDVFCCRNLSRGPHSGWCMSWKWHRRHAVEGCGVSVLPGCIESTGRGLYKHWEFQACCHCRERIVVWICSKMFEIVSLEHAQFCWHPCFTMLLQLSPIQLLSNYNLIWFIRKDGETTTCGFQVPAVCMRCKWDYKAKVLARTRSLPSVRVAQFWHQMNVAGWLLMPTRWHCPSSASFERWKSGFRSVLYWELQN